MALNATLIQTPMVQRTGLISEPWRVYFRDQDIAVSTATSVTITPTIVTGQTAAITTTAVPTPSLAAGLYRLTWYARITTAAGVSSSLTPSFSWTDGGIACSVSASAITGNTTATTGTDTYLLQIDGATPISYATAYASNPASVMAYTLAIVLETVGS